MTRLRAFAVGFVFAGLGIVLGAQVTKFPASASASPAITCQAAVTLTDAQIKALPTTSVVILPAVGASTLLIPIAIGWSSTLVSDYTNLDIVVGPSVRVDYAASSSLVGFLKAEGGAVQSLLTGAGADAFGTMPADLGGLPSVFLYVATQPGFRDARVDLSASNGEVGDFTGGNAANTLTVSVLYSIVNTTTGVFQACP